jgi:hypothetical protein
LSTFGSFEEKSWAFIHDSFDHRAQVRINQRIGRSLSIARSTLHRLYLRNAAEQQGDADIDAEDL